MNTSTMTKQLKEMKSQMKQGFKSAAPILHKEYNGINYAFSTSFACGQYLVKIEGETPLGKQVFKVPAVNEKSEFAAINYAGKKIFNNWVNVR